MNSAISAKRIGPPDDFFISADGLRIRYGFWPCGQKGGGTPLLLLSGRKEFMEKYRETITELNQRRYDVYSLDWRGQGLSDRQLADRHKGFVRDYQDYLDDLDRLLERIVRTRTDSVPVCMAHSMGAHILLRYLHDHPGSIARAVLVSAMIDIHLPFCARRLIPLIVRLAKRLHLEDAYVPGAGAYGAPDRRFAGNRLTSDRRRFAREHRIIAERPDLALGGVTYAWLGATLRSIDRLRAPGFGRRIRTPVLMLSAEKDRIVCNRAQQQLCGTMRACSLTRMAGARHEILMECDSIRAAFWEAFDGFMAAGGRTEGDRPGGAHDLF